MRSLVGEYSDKRFSIVGVNSDRELWIPQHLIDKGKVTWRSFHDRASKPSISEEWDVSGWPTIVLIDQQGVIRQINAYGSLLTAKIEQLFDEASK